MFKWVDIGGLQYLVLGMGAVVKRRGMGYLKMWPDKDGYLKVSITTKNGTVNEFVHLLVYRAFKGPIPKGMTVDHIDNDKTNNWLDNLQLMPAIDNVIKGNAKWWTIISPDGEEIIVYNLRGFCRINGLHHSHLYSGKYKGWSLKDG